MVLPMAFIPAAERYQMMPAIDRWVLSATLAALHERLPALGNVSICAINLSGQSLCDDHFLASVVDMLEAASVNPTHICFEITETAHRQSHPCHALYPVLMAWVAALR
jgi:EAL domain-containing protein (putative c-di-GMP-specific phosphodiesterase class I)